MCKGDGAVCPCVCVCCCGNLSAIVMMEGGASEGLREKKRANPKKKRKVWEMDGWLNKAAADGERETSWCEGEEDRTNGIMTEVYGVEGKRGKE